MNRTDIQRVADLSRLAYREEEIDTFAAQFERILDYVGAINALDMDGIEPQATVNETVNVLRDDVVGECLTTEEALSNAPKKNEAFIKVPKVLG
jgi:aspartyl-tRNA(Asn)/glutamyl-tRNA(Gln) amidotransferase subunit C